MSLTATDTTAWLSYWPASTRAIPGGFLFNVNSVMHFHHLSCYLIIAYIKSPRCWLSNCQGCTVHTSYLVMIYSSYHSHLTSTSSLCFVLFSLLCVSFSPSRYIASTSMSMWTHTLTQTAIFYSLHLWLSPSFHHYPSRLVFNVPVHQTDQLAQQYHRGLLMYEIIR